MSAGEHNKLSPKTLRWVVLAFTAPSTVLAGIFIGGGLGYFLDARLHTAPWLMIILGLLGLAGALRDALLSITRSKKAAESANV